MIPDIIEKLKKAICEINVVVEEDDIPLDRGLMSSGVIDSVGFVEFVVFIENEFNIEFDDDEINEENFENLTKIAEFINNKAQQ